MTKYKVGDIVVVKSAERLREEYSQYYSNISSEEKISIYPVFVCDMWKYCGKEFRIRSVSDDIFSLEDLNGDYISLNGDYISWNWADWMVYGKTYERYQKLKKVYNV